jgi:hypothetical protein
VGIVTVSTGINLIRRLAPCRVDKADSLSHKEANDHIKECFCTRACKNFLKFNELMLKELWL